MKIFIIHGSYGNSKENWFPWMKKKLEMKGHEVIIPKFPTPENQSLDSWIKVFKPYFEKIDSNTVFIGHSLGSSFILSILERINVKVRACFFVAGFVGLLGKEEFDSLNKTFITRSFDWDKIRKNCPKFYIFNSKDDPYVPIEKGQELANKLKTELIKVENAGHFNENSGYNTFPKLLNQINNLN